MNEVFFYSPEREERRRIGHLKVKLWRKIITDNRELSFDKCRDIYMKDLVRHSI